MAMPNCARLNDRSLLPKPPTMATALPKLYGHYDAIGGYHARSRAATLLHGLGFTTRDEQRAVREFSGGWRVRLNVAQALMCRSDLLLLDEPTNHLDLDAVLWLETMAAGLSRHIAVDRP